VTKATRRAHEPTSSEEDEEYHSEGEKEDEPSPKRCRTDELLEKMLKNQVHAAREQRAFFLQQGTALKVLNAGMTALAERQDQRIAPSSATNSPQVRGTRYCSIYIYI
jgi:hypothetical protein